MKIRIGKILDELYILRLEDEETKYFEALWRIPEGVTYNAYLLLGEENVLFDTWKHTYSREFLQALSKVVDVKDVDYIVVHHAEPDHSGVLPRLLEKNPNIKVICNPLAKRLLESFYNVKFRTRLVKDNERIRVGGRSLRFIYTPWLHWPETMMTYYEEERILFSCDAFGGFSIPQGLCDDDGVPEAYWRSTRKYLVSIVGHYREWILKNIEKIRGLGLNVEIIAPSHGLVFKKDPGKIIEYYARIAEGKATPGKATVIYSSMYGFVEKAIKNWLKGLSLKALNQ